MRRRVTIPIACAIVCAMMVATAPAETAPLRAPCPPFLFAAEGAKKILRYGAAGTVEWEYPAEMARDVWQLPNGNVLFPYNLNYGKPDNPSGVIEVTSGKEVVWEFKTTGQVFSCQRLADGNTLIGAASQGKLLIVSPRGEVVKEIKVANKPGHSCMRNARQLANGHFLVAEENSMAAREYDAGGRLVREFKVMFPVYSAVRLPDGHTLLCGRHNIAELDAAGATVWMLDAKEVPELGIRWFAGIHHLPNGNLFICNAGGKVGFAEISRAKKIVWQSNADNIGIPIGHGIQRLDAAGPPLK